MQKVNVNKDVFEALGKLFILFEGDQILEHLIYLTGKYTNGIGWVDKNYEALNNLTLKEFMACLHYGYELEETKGDKLIRFYNTGLNDKSLFSSRENLAYKQGIIDCYEILQGNSFPFK